MPRENNERQLVWNDDSRRNLSNCENCTAENQPRISNKTGLVFAVYTEGEVTSQNLYGHDTTAILWVYHGVMCAVKGRRFIVLFKQIQCVGLF